MFYFLSISEANQVFKKINQIKMKQHCLLCSSKCVTGEKRGRVCLVRSANNKTCCNMLQELP